LSRKSRCAKKTCCKASGDRRMKVLAFRWKIEHKTGVKLSTPFSVSNVLLLFSHKLLAVLSVDILNILVVAISISTSKNNWNFILVLGLALWIWFVFVFFSLFNCSAFIMYAKVFFMICSFIAVWMWYFQGLQVPTLVYALVSFSWLTGSFRFDQHTLTVISVLLQDDFIGCHSTCWFRFHALRLDVSLL